MGCITVHYRWSTVSHHHTHVTSSHSYHYKYSHDCGDAKEKFSIQSAGKAFNYGFFNDAIGREEVIAVFSKVLVCTCQMYIE